MRGTRRALFAGWIFCVALVLAALFVSPSLRWATVPTAPRSPAHVLWGIGDELGPAIDSPLYRNGIANMVTAWYNGPADLAWASGYSQPSTVSDIYGSGKAIELVVFLADHPTYAVSDQFQHDIKTLVTAMRGSGPHYGPLYVVLFTEWETYSSDPAYPTALKRAYLSAVNAVHSAYSGARVALGFGGYEWSQQSPHRDLSFWRDAIGASDFTAVQAMQDCKSNVNGQNVLVPQIRASVRQLGSYGKPVMISHFKLWGDPVCQVAAFEHFAGEVLTADSLDQLTADGLFAWGFMNDYYINGLPTSPDTVRPFLHAHASRVSPFG